MYRTIILAIASSLLLTAWTPAPAPVGAGGGDGLVHRVVEQRQDHNWTPPTFQYNSTDVPVPVAPQRLGGGNTCQPVRTKTGQGQCTPVSGSWGSGILTSYYEDGCGGKSTTQEGCYQSCVPQESLVSRQGGCRPSNGVAGPGTERFVYSDGCGNNFDRPTACCYKGDMIASTTECKANSGTSGPGTFTRVHDNGCGEQWNEFVACEVAPPPPTNSDEILVCIDFEEYSVRFMPFDFGGNLNDHTTVWGQPSHLRWDNRHSCLYKFKNDPPDTYMWGSPFYCSAWGHPDPAHGYCYAENPRFDYFWRLNQGEKQLRDSIGEGALWLSERGKRYNVSPADVARFQAFGRGTDAWKDSLGIFQRQY